MMWISILILINSLQFIEKKIWRFLRIYDLKFVYNFYSETPEFKKNIKSNVSNQTGVALQSFRKIYVITYYTHWRNII